MKPENAEIERGQPRDERVTPRGMRLLVGKHCQERGIRPPSPTGRKHDGRPEETDRNRHRDAAGLAHGNGNGPEPAVRRRIDRPSSERKSPRRPQTEHESQQHHYDTGEVHPERHCRPRPLLFSRRFHRDRFDGDTCHGGLTSRRGRRGGERPRIPLSGLQRGRLSRWRRQGAACDCRHRNAAVRNESGQRRHEQHCDEHDRPCRVAGRAFPHSKYDQRRRNKGRHHRHPHG